MPHIQAVFTGGPKEISDAGGTWTSSIFRDRTKGAVRVSFQGLAGDKVAQPYHGSAGAAVCAHLADHYAFWRAHYGLDLQAGYVGENLTIENLKEDEVHVGDVVRLGTSLVQVSGPRVPCANLARRIGRSDWVKLTVQENRTGFYLRVLQPGVLQEGDSWLLLDRINIAGSISSINRCMYLDFDPDYARTLTEMAGLEAWWKDQARQKLGNREHWTTTMKDESPPEA